MILFNNILNPISNFRNRVLCFILILGSINLTSAQEFEFTPELKTAYKKIIQLELEQGQALIDSLKILQPSNKLIFHIENYIDFFTCFIDEDPIHFDAIRKNKDKRLVEIKSGDPNSPYFRFSQAEVLLQWAVVRLKFREYPTAILEINKAIKLLEENVILHPEFVANKKSLSALHALIGTIPETYKNMLSWVSSFNGSIQQGQEEINEVYEYMQDKDFIFDKEVIAIKALIELHLVNDKSLAYKTINERSFNPTENPLICFIAANVTHKAGYNDEAIEIIQSFSPSISQHPLYYLDYLHGIYKLHRLDKDSDRYIRRYLNYFDGQNYIKEAYQKLAWYEWALHGNVVEYNRNMEYCSTRGNDLIDEDKQALSYTKIKELPNRNLLKARLLNDGGYQSEALQLLESVAQENRTAPQEIEYQYRSGRIAQGLNRDEKAIQCYLTSLACPTNNALYYQTAAALYLGQVYERNQEILLAEKYYKICLKYSPDQYKSSLHQKAKAGLLRLENSQGN